ncbi:MAG: glycosyltransferase involved in cell wall biosynthesis [Hyphomicrobiaceae bacterium]|jgi:glycosyltransferase involved in cell wall biosynthesis
MAPKLYSRSSTDCERSPLNVAQIVASLDNAAAGPSYSVVRLTEALAERGQNVELMSTTNATRTKDVLRSCEGPHRSFATDLDSLGLGKLAFSSGLRGAIDVAASSGAVLHSHGLWLMPNFYSAGSAKRRNCVHIISPRGMLGSGALKFSQRRKQLLWMLAQKGVVKAATCLHATSQQECDELRELGIKVPVAVIPNGVDLPVLEGMSKADAVRLSERHRTVLYLGRLHPKKGIDQLVAAWARLEANHPNWRLRIVGPSENGCRRQLEAQSVSLGLDRVSFEDGLFGADKDAAYRDAELFVLPTLNDNFGMVVAEALSHATPVICTHGAPWQGLESYGCGWWVEQGAEPLTVALVDALQLSRCSLAEKGKRGRAWMAASFSWGSVAHDMEQVYRWCAAGDERPSCVDIV